MLRRFSKRWISRGGDAARALVALAVVGCCLGAVALAATRAPRVANRYEPEAPLAPRLTGVPEAVTAETSAEFGFAQPGRPGGRAKPGGPALRFECRLDDEEWEFCESPLLLRGVRRGAHRFEARAVNRSERRGPSVAYRWRVRRAERAQVVVRSEAPPEIAAAEPPPLPPEPPAEAGAPFTVEQLATPADLYPGEPAQPLSVRLHNPGIDPIAVTALSAELAADPPGCPGIENFLILPSTASPATPVAIDPEASVTLPAQGVLPPAIAMRELPFSQDACQGAELELRFSGEASG
jgi:hypothetical protein